MLKFVATFLVFALLASGSHAAPSLSKGPIDLTASDRARSERALKNAGLGLDEDCHTTAVEKAATEVPSTEIPDGICNGRSREIVYAATKRIMVACFSQKVEMAMRISHGSNGLGKTVRGNRKSPVGTYWLGHPRASEKYGVFIPVGYPNSDELKKGYTGSDIGIHGPLRFLKCTPHASLAGNWTAGCLAMGRDTQVVELSRWILDQWPVKLTIKNE